MQLLKHVANAMQRTEDFVLERALVYSHRFVLQVYSSGYGSMQRIVHEKTKI